MIRKVILTSRVVAVATLLLSGAAGADDDALGDAGDDVASEAPDAAPDTNDPEDVGVAPESALDVVSPADTTRDGAALDAGADTRADGPRPYTLLEDDDGACTAGGRGRPTHPLFLLALGLLLGRVLRRRTTGGRT